VSRVFLTYRKELTVLSSFMTYQHVCYWRNTGANGRAVIAYPSRTHEFIPDDFEKGSCCPIFLVFCVVFCRSLFVLLFFFSPLRCLDFFYLRILVTTLVSFLHCVVWTSSIYGFWLPLWYLFSIALSVLLRFKDSGYHFGIFSPLRCLYFLDLRILITTLVSSSSSCYNI
jgi:hypothetical protein